jgi:type I restriction enzyme S subunit
MDDWKEVDLEAVAAELTVGHVGPMVLEYRDSGVPFIRSTDIEPFKIKRDQLKYINPEFHARLKKSALKPGDVLIVRTGKPGTCAMIPDDLLDANCSDVVIVRAGPELHPRYLTYYINSAARAHIDAYSGGAVQQHFNVGAARSIRMNLPPIVEQERIVGVLGALDDKIDLLHRQNKTLEAMAETLFRQWFVEEAEEGWAWEQLGSHVELFRGLSYTGAGLCEKGEGVPMHNLNSVCNGGGYKYQGIKYYAGEYKDRHVVRGGDIIVANTDLTQNLLLIGCPAIVPMQVGTESVYSHHLYKLSILNPALSTIFLYHLLLSADVRDQITGATNGSTVNMLPKDGIEMAKFQMPPKDKIERFNAIAAPLQQKQEKNYIQIQTLIAQRDTLLPKLMSGEVRVEELKHSNN